MTEPKPLPEKMQALLSRAVEKQVTEQRAVVDLLAEMRVELEALQTSVTGLDGRLDALAQPAGEAVTSQLDQLISRPVIAPADLEAMTSHLEGLPGSLAMLVSRVEALQDLHGGLTRVAEDVSAVRNDTSSIAIVAGLAAMREDVEVLHDLVKELPTQVMARQVESEQRIMNHVDEAVFTLAEALLRPRAGAPEPEEPEVPEAPEVDSAESPAMQDLELTPDVMETPSDAEPSAITHRGRWRR